MYGTVAMCEIRAENLDAFRHLMDQQSGRGMDGWVGTDVLVPNNHANRMVLVVRFRDRASYEANAGSPAQHERYLQMRALLESDPVWHDGDWVRIGS